MSDTAAKRPALPPEAAPQAPCRLCGASASAFMQHGEFAILRCAACGFMFAAPPEHYDFDAVYSDDAYWTGGRDWGYPDYDQEWNASKRFQLAQLERLGRLIQPGRMFEVGCAAGYFLKAAQARGWRVAGVELSEMMRRRCAQVVDCPLYGSLAEAAASASRFDCVVMLEVIEHLPEPLNFLRQVRALMAPGGVLALSTPNFGAPEAMRNPAHFHWFSPPAHVSYFTAATLRDCVARAGFVAIEIAGVIEGDEMPLPRPLAALLRPFRQGKRLRPGGLAGKLIKAYQRRRRDLLQWANAMSLYARTPA